MTNIVNSACAVAPELAASTTLVSVLNEAVPFESVETTVVTVASAALAVGIRWLIRKIASLWKRQ